MERKKYLDGILANLSAQNVEDALETAVSLPTSGALYELIGTQGRSRSYFVDYKGRRFPLKAIVALALREKLPSVETANFHAKNAARTLEDFGFHVLHISTKAEQRWLERQRKAVEILHRPGQARFRARLLKIFGSTCPISDCAAADALDAVHISEVQNDGSDEPANGLVLRTDLHRLFDRNLLAINPETSRAWFSPTVLPSYEELNGIKLTLPPGGPRLGVFLGRWKRRFGVNT
ncbi:MAG: HNH endonuclease [Pacificimonas sp.]